MPSQPLFELNSAVSPPQVISIVETLIPGPTPRQSQAGESGALSPLPPAPAPASVDRLQV